LPFKRQRQQSFATSSSQEAKVAMYAAKPVVLATAEGIYFIIWLFRSVPSSLDSEMGFLRGYAKNPDWQEKLAPPRLRRADPTDLGAYLETTERSKLLRKSRRMSHPAPRSYTIGLMTS
jgi:hypothetical protein